MCFIFFLLKGLKLLQNLKELNLADNNIEKIGRFLESSVFSMATFTEIYFFEKKKIFIKYWFTSFKGIALILMSAFTILICPETRSAPLR